MRTYQGRTLDEWRAAMGAGEDVPQSITQRIERSDASKERWKGFHEVKADDALADREERRQALRDQNPPRPTSEERQETLLATMQENGERFFRECGAIDAEGQYHFNDQVLSGLFRKAVVVVNHHLELGSLDAAKLVIDKVVPEAQKAISEMSAEELRAERERRQQELLAKLSPEARTELMTALAARRKELEGGGQ